MPLYDYLCDAGHEFERFVKLVDYDHPQLCGCGCGADRKISAPRVISDYIAPILGADGKMHDSMAGYRRSLTPSGNKQGERYIEVGNESLKATPKTFDKKQRRNDIKAAIADVKAGRLPPVTISPVT